MDQKIILVIVLKGTQRIAYFKSEFYHKLSN